MLVVLRAEAEPLVANVLVVLVDVVDLDRKLQVHRRERADLLREIEFGDSLIRTLEGHSDWVRGVAVSGDGRRAVSASEDKTLKVWDVESGVLLATFTCDAAARCCAFINERELIAGDDLGRVHFLRLEEPKAKG